MRWRIAIVGILALFLAVSCQQQRELPTATRWASG
jgi:hypothetical protein